MSNSVKHGPSNSSSQITEATSTLSACSIDSLRSLMRAAIRIVGWRFPEGARRGACLLLEQFHVEQKGLADDVFVVEQPDERFLAAQFLDVQGDGRVGIGSEQREKILRRRFMR